MRIGVTIISTVLVLSACAGAPDRGGDDAGGRRGTATSIDPVNPGASSTALVAPRPRIEVLDSADPGFYTVPDPLPAGDHGDLIRTQPVTGAPTGVRWQRIMYLSQTLTGEPTVVTGVLTLPEGDPPPGGWPLFAHAHGSTGIADPCAPSTGLQDGGAQAVEIKLMSAWVRSLQIAVVSTDYEGLGGPGPHPFLIGESEGRSVLDSILAARQTPGANFRGRVGIIGYSQGGHAAAWANQIARDWTPGLDVVGVLAGAPATELGALIDVQGDGAALLIVGALAAVDPRLDPATALTEGGLSALTELQQSCGSAIPPDSPLTKVDVRSTEPWAGAIRANEPGSSAGAAPLLIVHSAKDRNVPIESSAAFQARYCTAGGVVERRVLEEGDHIAAAIPAYQQGIDWILGLSAGAEPVSTCP